MSTIGRQLRKNELGQGWAYFEPVENERDEARVEIGKRLEDEGYMFLADLSGDSLDDSKCVITPSERVLTPYEVYTANTVPGIIKWVPLSKLEGPEVKKAEEYLLAYCKEFFDP